MPDDTIDRIHQLASQDILSIVIKDRSGLEAFHKLPPEQEDNDDNNSIYVPDGDDDQGVNNGSLSSISSLEDAPI
eukprot:973122-Ditylum_brightwellii.AAC.2